MSYLKTFWEHSFSSLKENKKEILEAILLRLSEFNFHYSLNHNEIQLIIDEALTNAMEHGNKWSIDAMVSIKISSDDNNIYISIQDEGTGFNVNNHQNKPYIPTSSRRGRGIFIIERLIKPYWNSNGTEITLPIPIIKKKITNNTILNFSLLG